MTTKQIWYLIINLENLHSNNAYILNRLNAAKDSIDKNLNYSVEIVSNIINLPDLGPEIEKKHQLVMKEAADVANVLYAKLSIKICDRIGHSWNREVGVKKINEQMANNSQEQVHSEVPLNQRHLNHYLISKN